MTRYRYFKRPWDETRGDQYDAWGTSVWYFELDADGSAVRQVEEYASGVLLKYSETEKDDEYGTLADQPIDLDEGGWEGITSAEFESVWRKQGFGP
jgi:hypothetical protein